jgi:hypothetical protein
MRYAIAGLLPIAGLLGIVGTYTIGGYVHALLVVALLLLAIGMLSGRRRFAIEPNTFLRSSEATYVEQQRA